MIPTPRRRRSGRGCSNRGIPPPANKVKARANVTVVIGNPPYKELAVGEGGWVENGGREHGKATRAILEDFFVAGAGRFKAKLKNLYI
jgi:hypothetical protein